MVLRRREIRSIDAEVKIVIVTAYSEKLVNFQKVIGSGFIYLKKPFIEAELLQLTQFLVDAWQAAQEARQESKRLKMASVNRARLVHAITHELRTPLTVLLASKDQLAEGELLPDQRNCLQRIDEFAKRLLYTLDDVAHHFEVDLVQSELARYPFDLGVLLEELKRDFLQWSQVLKVRLQFRYAAPLLHYVVGDRIRTKQALHNLLNSAIHRSPEGGEVVLAVAPQEGGAVLHFSVSEDGGELSKQMLEQIFDPQFDQLSEQYNNKCSHCWVWLFITKELTQQMEGTFSIENLAESRVQMDLKIPLQIGNPLPRLKQEPATATDLQDKGRALIVDDAVELRTLVGKQLEEMGLEVVTAEDGDQAIEQAAQQPFDFILMDVRMPLVDGISATKAIRKQGVNTPVIMLAADATESLRGEAKTAGAVAVLQKPVDEVLLRQIVTLYCFG